MTQQVMAYKCQWCNMVSLTRSSVVRHEKKSCRMHKSCQLCKHYSEEWEDDGSGLLAAKEMWCGVIDDRIFDKVTDCPTFEDKP